LVLVLGVVVLVVLVVVSGVLVLVVLVLVVLVLMILVLVVLVLGVFGRVGMLVLALFWLVLMELSVLVELTLGSILGSALSSDLVLGLMLLVLSGFKRLVILLGLTGLEFLSILAVLVFLSILTGLVLLLGFMGTVLLLVIGLAGLLSLVLGLRLAVLVLVVVAEDAVEEKNKMRRTKTAIFTSSVPAKSDLTMLSLSVLQLQVLGSPTISPCSALLYLSVSGTTKECGQLFPTGFWNM